jgi:hypothetical protein
MKKTALTFGLISAVVSSLMMLMTVPFLDRIGFEYGQLFGYTAIVLSFLLVFFGVRSYRENVGGGVMTFGRGFTVGLLITLMSCAGYVLTWQVIYFKLSPGFMDKYQAYAIERARASGASDSEVRETARQMESFKKLYDKPLFNAAVTFLEPFPIGLVVTLVSAAVLRRREPVGVRRGSDPGLTPV